MRLDGEEVCSTESESGPSLITDFRKLDKHNNRG